MPSDESGSGATFNIGSQQGNITNVGRDMHVHGDQRNQVAMVAPEILAELGRVREAARAASLPPEAAQAADQALAEAEEELRRPEPDPPKVAGAVERAAETIKRFGGLAAAGVALIEPLQRIASLLGPMGNSILRLLH